MLAPDQRTKIDQSDDVLFYEYPRFVTHVDDRFISSLRALFSDRLKPDTRILDLQSSWVSHLPTDIQFAHVEGHGLNAEELARNSQLNHFFVQNLNQNQKLPLADREFDAVIDTVSVQYLQYPEAVFSEIHRILKPGGVAIMSFSNRMFYQKAIAAWRDSSDLDRVQLVKRYFNSVPGFSKPEVITHPAQKANPLWWLSLGGDPFYAVLAYKN